MNENLVQYVLEAQKGDVDAFAKLYSRTLKNSYFLSLKLTADKGEAENIFKNAYAVAFCTIEKLKRPEAFETWIKQKIAAAYKDTQSFVFSDADGDARSVSSEFLPAGVLNDSAVCKRIEAEVEALPVEQRTVAVLYYCVGMPVDYIARFLSVSQSTVNSLLSKAKTAISYVVPDNDDPISEDPLPVLTRIFKRSASNTVIDNDLVRRAFVYAVDSYENRELIPSPAEVKREEPAKPAEAPAEKAEKDPFDELRAEVDAFSAAQRAAAAEPEKAEKVKVSDKSVDDILNEYSSKKGRDANSFDPASVLGDVKAAAEEETEEDEVIEPEEEAPEVPILVEDDKPSAEPDASVNDILSGFGIPTDAVNIAEPQTELVLPVIDETDPDANKVEETVVEPKTIIISSGEKPSDAVSTGDDFLKEIERSIADLNSDPDFGPAVSIPETGGEYISTEEPAAEAEDEIADELDAEEKPVKKINGKLFAAVLAVIIVAGIAAGYFLTHRGGRAEPETTTAPTVSLKEGKTPKKKIISVPKISKYSNITYLSENFCAVELSDAENGSKAFGLIDYEGNVLVEPSEDYVGFVACSDGRVYSDERSYHYLVQLKQTGKYHRIIEEKLGTGEQFYENTEHEKETAVNVDDVLEKSKFYDERDRTHNNCTAVRDKNTKKWGYIDMNGKIVVSCSYEPANLNCDPSVSDYCYPVSTDGLVPVRKNGKMGIVDIATNNAVVDFSYESILPGSNGVFIAKNVEGWCFILIGDAVDKFDASEQNTDPNAPVLPEGATPFTGKYKVNNYSGLNIRAEKDIYSDLVGEVDYQEEITVFGKGTDLSGEEWYYIHFTGSTNNDLYGWAKSKNFTSVDGTDPAQEPSSSEDEIANNGLVY